MRSKVRTAVWALLASSVLGATAFAQMRLEFEPPARLVPGDRASVVLRIHAPGPHPILVTPRTEGAAVELARGRLQREDATEAEDGSLEFRIPVIAHEPGPATLHVQIATYECRTLCRAVEAHVETALRVERGEGTDSTPR